MPDWKKIKAEYIRGVSYRRLTEKYGVSFSSIQKRGAKEKWTDLRKKSSRKTDEKLIESVANQEAKRVDKVESIADRLLQMINERINDGTLIIDAKDLRAVTASIKDLREIKGYKSELDMQEQMARIEKLRKEAQTNTELGEVGGVVLLPEVGDFND